MDSGEIQPNRPNVWNEKKTKRAGMPLSCCTAATGNRQLWQLSRGLTAQRSGSLVITVHTPPEVRPGRHLDQQRGWWKLVFWAGEAFDYAIPFHVILAEITGTLGRHAETELWLPEHKTEEDFIEGQLRFGPHVLGVYFEHSLGFFSLDHPDRAPLDEAWAILESTVRIA